MGTKAKQPVSVIVGLGGTGLSCARYFAARGEPVKIVDSRSNPPGLSELRRLLPQTEVECGDFSATTMVQAKQLVVSPGVSLKTVAIAAAREAGVPVTGDIDIFSKQARAPIIAVTGSNGKSTVVALVAAILRKAGVDFGLGGNLDGENYKPALDLLEEGDKDFFVLEISSFQLETTERLGAAVAAILNISPDHMDRYSNLLEYAMAKQAIYNGCKRAAVSRDDPSGHPHAGLDVPIWEYGVGLPGEHGVGLRTENNREFIAVGRHRLVAVDELKIVGQHNISNAMAATALTLAVGIDEKSIALGLREFAGLPHRCQRIASIQGVEFINDSKGTNVGATIAAIEGLAKTMQGKIVLIAGGIGKDADFSLLAPVLQRWVRAVVVIGQDGMKIAEQVKSGTTMRRANSMQAAVSTAAGLAQPGDTVLLSPACASFDMFDNFQHRGQVFSKAVESLQ